MVEQPLANPLRVVVTEDGVPLPGANVAWATTAVGGSVDPGSAATDAEGVASTMWTVGTASGAQTASATLSGASGSPVTFTATAAAGPAATLAKGGGDEQTAEIGAQLPSPVQARVTDEHGNGVAGTAVGWEATGATVSSPSVPSVASGLSSVTVTAGGVAGPIVITAAADGLVGSPLTFNASAVAPAPIPVTASVTVGNPSFFRSDRNGTDNPAVDTVAAGGRVTWTWDVPPGVHNVDSEGSPGFPDSPLGSGPSYSFTFPTVGTYQYTCAAHPGAMTGRIVVR